MDRCTCRILMSSKSIKTCKRKAAWWLVFPEDIVPRCEKHHFDAKHAYPSKEEAEVALIAKKLYG